MKRHITILLTVVLLFALTACATKSKPTSFEDSCWEQVKNCKTTELEDGKVSVSLSAPDYTVLLEYLAENGVGEELTVEMLAEAAENHPDAVREYTFVADSSDDEAIRKALLENISNEMLILVMKDYVG